jgi:hypothetical protein
MYSIMRIHQNSASARNACKEMPIKKGMIAIILTFSS